MTKTNFDRTLENLLRVEVKEKKRAKEKGQDDDDQIDSLDQLPDDGDYEGEDEDVELVPVRYENVESKVPANPEDVSDISDDYRFARSNLYGLIGRSNAAIELSMKLAALSEQPRALEVIAQLMRASSDMTKELMALQKTLAKEQTAQSPPAVQNNTQNNHYYSAQEANEASAIDSELDGLIDETETGTDSDS